MIWTIFAFILALWILGLTSFILLERRPPAATIAWIMALAFLPVLGIPVYFLLGPRKWKRKSRHRKQAQERVEREIGELLPPREEPEFPPDRQPLVRLLRNITGIPVSRAKEFTLYTEGVDFYAALADAIGGARHHVHLEFYIWEADRIGRRFRDLLVEKAGEGVAVRVLLDALGSKDVRGEFFKPLRDAGGEVAFFNQVRLPRLRPPLVNFRNHRKIVVVDGVTGFTGGMNVVDYHTSEMVGIDARRDTHLRVRGQVVRWLQVFFLENWHFLTGKIPDDAEQYLALDETGGAHLVEAVPSGPDDDTYPIHALFLTGINHARERVLISTPYFVPDEPIVIALQNAAARGVDVRILVPGNGDHPLVSAASRTYYEDLLSRGVRIFEYGPRMHHAKTMVVDTDLSVVGTANMDNRSFRLNFEVVLVIHEEEMATALAGHFEKDLLSCREVTLADGRSPYVDRVVEGVARLFSPLL